MAVRQSSVALIAYMCSSCSAPDIQASATQVATLYRNGSMMTDMRLHFGSFDAEGEANDFNISNCRMTARLLNQNVKVQIGGNEEQKVGFWCEPGFYREDGRVPQSFDAAFPSDVEGLAAP